MTSGKNAVAAAMPSPSSPTARPRRRTNQMFTAWRLTSDNAPCPRPRISTNPTSSMTRPLTRPMKAQASAKSEAMTMTPTRGPRRSMKRPMNGSVSAPVRVPMVYISETVERETRRSSMMRSRNTDTPSV